MLDLRGWRGESETSFSLEGGGGSSPAGGAFRPLAILLATSVNQDGRSSSLTAPNGPSQQAALRRALAAASAVYPHLAAGADGRRLTVSSAQLHGTGTPLGDPIEVAALLAVHGSSGVPDAEPDEPAPPGGSWHPPPLVLSSLKASVGHAEPAAGVLGLLAAAGCASEAAVARLLHLRAPSPHVCALLMAQQQGGAARARGVLLPRAAAAAPWGGGGGGGSVGPAAQPAGAACVSAFGACPPLISGL